MRLKELIQLEKDGHSPYRYYYNGICIVYAFIMIFSSIPFVFVAGNDELTGFWLIYFICWMCFSVLGSVLILLFLPYIKKKEIEFFIRRYSVENLNKYLNVIKLNSDNCKFDAIDYHTNEPYIDMVEFCNNGLRFTI